MSRYGKYFLQHLLWLEDNFCDYYVQSESWGRPEILDVEYVIFNYGEDAAYWIVQCAKWDPHTTIRRLRSFLAKDCLTQYQVHRMNDRQVVRTAARELCMNAYRMVIEPKMGWAVRLDPQTQEPAQPIAVEGAPEIDGMLDKLKVELDALVAGQKQNYVQWEAKLAKMSEAEKAALYGKKAGGGLYNATIGSIVDLVKAAPGLAKKWASVWWTFHTYPLRLADITAEAIRTGSTEPLQKELQTKLGPVVQSARQLKHFTSMAMVLLSEPATRDMLLDFVERYWDNTHPLEKTEMGAEAASDVVITILLAIFTAGVGAAANIAAKSGRLVKVAKMLEKLAGALKRIKSMRKLPKKRKRLGKGRSRRKLQSKSSGKGPHQPKTPDKKPDVDGKKKSGYSDNKDKSKKKGPKNFTVDNIKHKYFFGEVDPPSPSLKETNPKKYKKLKHNYDRSQQIKKELEKVDIHNNDAGRKKILEIFDEAAENPPINKHEGPFGTTLTKSTIYKGTKFDIKFFYEAGNMAKKPKVVSLIPKS